MLVPRILLLHHKELKWAHYLTEYTDLKTLEAAGQLTIAVDSLPQQNAHAGFAKLPEKVRRLLFFAKPDLVICYDDGVSPIQPIFAIDVTEHVAAADHWMQRFPNLVGCAQEGIPGAFVSPGNTPLRKEFRGRVDPAFYYAYERVTELHRTPIFIAEWPSRDGVHLDRDAKFTDLPPHDSPDIVSLLKFFNLCLDHARRGADITGLYRERMIVDMTNRLRKLAYKQIPSPRDYRRLTYNMPNGDYLNNADLNSWLTTKGLKLPAQLPDRIRKRDKNLIFTPQVTAATSEEKRLTLKKRIKERGGDPYGPQPLVFDYLFCRLGPSTDERDANLVLDFSVLKFEDFAHYVSNTWADSPLQETEFARISHQIPIYTLHLASGLSQTMKNFVRLSAFSADLIVFEEGVLYF